ncbi:hypothetical protein [Ferrimonas senticii]|uniref:hypothetical protein n=1 Tax=Ferrimonas senticii TaxID=394566 RepID=UPI00041886E0|nr:hypothetical protein [Ferrimonas senticii]
MEDSRKSRDRSQSAASADEQLPSGLVATMLLCVLTSVDREHLDELGDSNVALAFDLGIAVQVAEEEQAPLPDLLAEVFSFYNRQLQMSMPTKRLGMKVAERYYKSQEHDHQVH